MTNSAFHIESSRRGDEKVFTTLALYAEALKAAASTIGNLGSSSQEFWTAVTGIAVDVKNLGVLATRPAMDGR